MKLYEIDKGSKIYGLEPVVGDNRVDGGIIVFDHVDGMYSYCTVVESDGEPVKTSDGKSAIVHLNASMPLVEFEDGYKIDTEELKDEPN